MFPKFIGDLNCNYILQRSSINLITGVIQFLGFIQWGNYYLGNSNYKFLHLQFMLN